MLQRCTYMHPLHVWAWRAADIVGATILCCCGSLHRRLRTQAVLDISQDPDSGLSRRTAMMRQAHAAAATATCCAHPATDSQWCQRYKSHAHAHAKQRLALQISTRGGYCDKAVPSYWFTCSKLSSRYMQPFHPLSTTLDTGIPGALPLQAGCMRHDGARRWLVAEGNSVDDLQA